MKKVYIFILIPFFLYCDLTIDSKTIPGCLDINACNYNHEANVNNNTCQYVIDCTGICGGNAIQDSCGICDTISENNCIQDCFGEWGGNAVLDICGICNGEAIIEDDCCNDIDGNYYRTVKIGEQIWMADNLKTTRFRNGDTIPNFQSENNNIEIYGKYYSWYNVDDNRGICPDGFHIPSDQEIMNLEMTLGMNQNDILNTELRGTNEGCKLAGDKNLWNNGSLKNNNYFGLSGFNSIPGGYQYHNGDIYNLGNFSYFWTSTSDNGSTAWYRAISSNSTGIYRNHYFIKHVAFSVRCIKN